MKKVLIISYFFNQKEIIGSIRLQGLAKYLTKFGWKPTILTIKSNEGSDSQFRIIETKYSNLMDNWKSKMGLNPENNVKNQLKIENKKNNRGLIDFVIDMWVELFAYPDAEKNWYQPAVEAGSKLLEQEHFDAIISSAPPFTCHLIANELKNRYGIPWVADLRDLWTQNPYIDHLFFRKFLEKKLELKTLKTADALTTTTSCFKKDLKNLHKTKNVYTILNGFDPSYENQGSSLSDKFKLIYTGALYHGKRDPEPLFKALKELVEEGNLDIQDLVVEFYGSNEDWLIKDINNYNLKSVVKIFGTIPREEILKKQRKSQILLLFTWNNPKEKGVIPGKVFEYLAAKRPILSIGNPSGLVKDLIDSTNAGITSSSNEEIKKSILNFYNEFKIHGEVKYNGNPDEIAKYSHVGMSKKFSEVFDNIID